MTSSIYESMINPRLAEQLAQQTAEKEAEMMALYISHAQHIQSFDFQCDHSCVSYIRNVHEWLCNRHIVEWPEAPNVKVCQKHDRLYYDAHSTLQSHLASLYYDAFLKPSSALTENVENTFLLQSPCDETCPLLSVPMILYRAKKWQPAWMPLFVCTAHSTLHVCRGNGSACRNRHAYEHAEDQCVACLAGRVCYQRQSIGKCDACLAGRLCYQRCPMNVNSIDHDAAHICFFSKKVVGYLSAGEDVARRRVALATDFVPLRQGSRSQTDPARYADMAMDMFQQWMRYAIRQTNNNGMASMQLQVVDRQTALMRVKTFLIDHALMDEETGAMTIIPRDLWQYVPLLYVNLPTIRWTPVASDTMTLYEVARIMVTAYNELGLRRLTIAEMIQKLAEDSCVFQTCSQEVDDNGVVLATYSKKISPTPLLQQYALRMKECCPPSVVEWLAKTRAPMPAEEAPPDPPYCVANQLLKHHAAYFIIHE